MPRSREMNPSGSNRSRSSIVSPLPMKAMPLVLDRNDERSLKSRWGGYPALIIDPDVTHGGVYEGEFQEAEGDF